MPRFMSWIVNRLRHRRFVISGPKKLHSFALYYGTYSNWKNSPRPFIFVTYSGDVYTHAIAIQYLSSSDKAWFARTLFLIQRGRQIVDGVTMYRLIKARRPSIIKSSYRVYFTSLLNMRMVGAGLSNRFDEVTEGIYKDNWLMQLNENLMPSAMPPGGTTPSVAFSQTELRDRIVQAQNTVPLSQRSIRRAPWSQRTGRAPWLKP